MYKYFKFYKYAKGLFIVFVLAFVFTSCNNKEKKSKSDLIVNYEQKSLEIIEVKNYFNEIVSEKYKVNIRYKSPKVINLEVYERSTDSLKYELLFRKWNINFLNYEQKKRTLYEKKYHGKTNSLEYIKTKLNWTNNTFIELYEKLELAGCIGVSNGTLLTKIEYGYDSNGLGIYSYKIFDHNLEKEEIESFNDGCHNIFYKDNIIFSFDGGAIGKQCFEDFQQIK